MTNDWVIEVTKDFINNDGYLIFDNDNIDITQRLSKASHYASLALAEQDVLKLKLDYSGSINLAGYHIFYKNIRCRNVNWSGLK